MRERLFTILICAGTVAAFSPAMAGEPITLRDMGSFHIGGRVVEISGKPLKEVVFSAWRGPGQDRSERAVPGRADVCAVFSTAAP